MVNAQQLVPCGSLGDRGFTDTVTASRCATIRGALFDSYTLKESRNEPLASDQCRSTLYGVGKDIPYSSFFLRFV
jgi:hypothetical protein